MGNAHRSPDGIPSVSVIVCAFSSARLQLIDRCLDAIRSQLEPHDELILVIDHNPDLLETMTTARRPDTHVAVIANRSPRGLSGARNSGLERARGDIVAFVDDDAWVEPGWLDRVREHYRDPDVAAVGGSARPVWPQRRPVWFPEEFDWVVGCSHRGLPTTTAPVRNLIGCNMTFRRSALAGLGGFSAAVGRVGDRAQGCEETELCIRLQRSAPALRILFDPRIAVRHTITADRAGIGYFLRRCYREGISKSVVSSMAGARAGLSSERSYVVRVLPAAVLRGLLGAITGPGRPAHAARAGVTVLGLAVTTLGYATETVRRLAPRAGQ